MISEQEEKLIFCMRPTQDLANAVRAEFVAALTTTNLEGREFAPAATFGSTIECLFRLGINAFCHVGMQ